MSGRNEKGRSRSSCPAMLWRAFQLEPTPVHAQSSQSDIGYDYSTKRWTVKTHPPRPDSQNWPSQVDSVLPGSPPYVSAFASPQGPTSRTTLRNDVVFRAKLGWEHAYFVFLRRFATTRSKISSVCSAVVSHGIA